MYTVNEVLMTSVQLHLSESVMGQDGWAEHSVSVKTMMKQPPPHPVTQVAQIHIKMQSNDNFGAASVLSSYVQRSILSS